MPAAPRYFLSLGDSLSREVQPDPAGQNHPPRPGLRMTMAPGVLQFGKAVRMRSGRESPPSA
jgi:hypothetical protein